MVVDKEIDVQGTDFTPVITQVKAAKPDAFVVWVAGPAAVIITKQFAGSGIPLLMTGAEASNLYVEPAGQEGEGVTMTSNIAVPGRELPAGPLKESVDAFANPWLKANKGVYPPQFAFDGATGLQLLVAAIEKAKSTDREKVRDALESLDLLTPTGRFKFSPTDHGGIGKDTIAIVTVKGGEAEGDAVLARAVQDQGLRVISGRDTTWCGPGWTPSRPARTCIHRENHRAATRRRCRD